MCTNQEIPFVAQNYSSVTGVVAISEEPELAKPTVVLAGRKENALQNSDLSLVTSTNETVH
jgi:hypothetical protein